MQKKIKENKGITLIALVVMIIILLILAGITVSVITGENGLINKAIEAKQQTKIGEEKEIVSLSYYECLMDEDPSVTKDKLEKAVKGYDPNTSVSVSEDNEDDLIVTFDDTKNSYSVGKNGEVKQAEVYLPEPEPEKGDYTFTREWGVIEVVWLKDKGYEVTDSPNTPKMTEDMKAVYWDEATGEEIVDDGNEEFDENKWYNYTAQKGSTDGASEETKGTSHWANAVTEDGSYWVWIPRYAFRIVYFDTKDNRDAYRKDSNSKQGIIGYCDARGVIDTKGKRVPNISDYSTAVAVNDEKMRAHPAFEKDVNKGGWGERISGIWVAKYEMSQDTSSKKAVSKPSTNEKPISSWINITVGKTYTNGFDYDRAKESHLMKNSEWGAVAYLADSKYGRNGTEVTINNSSKYYTGMAGETVSASSRDESYCYNTEKGQLASTTGNIYGVYDMSGGAFEYVAAFNASSGLLKKGSTFAKPNGPSTKYATAYTNTSTMWRDNFAIGFLSAIGDGMQDTYL